MRILHTADWHLGKRLDRFSRLEEQARVLDEICLIAEKEEVDAVIIAGDLYDTYNPPTEAVELFYRTLKRLSKDGQRPVIAIAGNHDSPDRIEAPDPLARECGILLAGYPHSQLPAFRLDGGMEVTQSAPGFVELRIREDLPPLRLLLTPYANEVRIRRALDPERKEEALRAVLQAHWAGLADRFMDEQGVNLFVGHLFMIRKGQTPPEEPEDEKPIHVGGAQAIFTENLPSQLQYAALGHLHRPMEMGGGPCPVRYSGSPLAYSFAEANQTKSVVILDLEPGKEADIRLVELERPLPLLRNKFDDADEAVRWLKEVPEAYVELFFRTDSFITAAERRRFQEAHPRLIGPFPELTAQGTLSESGEEINLELGREALFRQYFRSREGLEPGDALISLFREIIGEEGAE